MSSWAERKRLRAKVYGSRRWRELREYKRLVNPWCEDCWDRFHKAVPMTSVHHIVPLYKDLSLAFEYKNLRSLCNDCHYPAKPLTDNQFVSDERRSEAKRYTDTARKYF